MAVTFEDRLLFYVGEALAGQLALSNADLEVQVNNGVKYVIGLMPRELRKNFMIKSAMFVPTTGLVIEEPIIEAVFREVGADDVKRCVEVSLEDSVAVFDSESIYYASEEFPVYYIGPETTAGAKVKVAPWSAAAIAYAVYIGYPTVDIDAAVYVIAGFPDGLEEAPIMYAAIQVLIRESSIARRDAQTEMEAITDSGIIAAFDAALPAYAGVPSPTMPTLTMPVMTALPDLTLPTDLAESDLDLSSISTPNFISPVEVTTPSATIAYVPPSEVNYSSTIVDAAILNAKDIMDSAGSSVITDDVFEKFDANEIEDAIARVQASASEVNRAAVEVQNQLGALQEYLANLQSSRNALEEQVSQFTGDIQNYAAQMNINVQKALGKYNGDIQKYATEVRAAVDDYVSERGMDVNIFRANLDKAIDTYAAQAQAYVSEYSAKTTAALGEYQASVTAVVGEYSAKVQGAVSEFQSDLSRALAILQKAGVRIQTANDYNTRSGLAMQQIPLLWKMFNDRLAAHFAVGRA